MNRLIFPDQWALACVDSRANFLGDGRYGKLVEFIRGVLGIHR